VKLTKSQLKQIIKEELEKILNEQGEYSVEKLTSGLISIFDRESLLRGTYNKDGTWKHGDLKLPLDKVKELLSK